MTQEKVSVSWKHRNPFLRSDKQAFALGRCKRAVCQAVTAVSAALHLACGRQKLRRLPALLVILAAERPKFPVSPATDACPADSFIPHASSPRTSVVIISSIVFIRARAAFRPWRNDLRMHRPHPSHSSFRKSLHQKAMRPSLSVYFRLIYIKSMHLHSCPAIIARIRALVKQLFCICVLLCRHIG